MNKKYVKLTVLLSVCAIVVGIIAAVAGLGALGFDVYALDSENYTRRTITAADVGSENIAKIEVDFDNTNFEIVGGDSFSFTCYESETVKLEYDFDAETGNLEIELENYRKFAFFEFFRGIKRSELKHTLTVPSGIEVYLKNSNSSIEANGVSLKSLGVRGSNASLKIESCDTEKFYYSGSNSSFMCHDSSFGSFSADGSNCALNIMSCSSDYINLSGSNASFKCDKSSFGSLVFSGSNAVVKIMETNCDKAELSGSNANVSASLKGKKEDYASVSMTGRNASFRFCGEDFIGNYSGGGNKTFSFSGNNARVKLILEE